MTSNNDTWKHTFAFTEAVYREHHNPDYAGNRLIACLEHYESDEALIQRLERLPKFSAEERDHTAAMRLGYLKRLFRLGVPLPRTITLARALIDLMFAGYRGRSPFSPELRGRQQALYAARMKGDAAAADELDADDGLLYDDDDAGSEFSTAFVGASGTGKTRTLRWIASLFPPVIYHPESDLWQVPVLIFELPEDGRSKHGLATAIIEALDKRLPHCGYGKLLMSSSWGKNADERIVQARKLVKLHAVGLLIADEAQRDKLSGLDHPDAVVAPKRRSVTPSKEEGKDVPLMTLLMRMSNMRAIPLVLTGTLALHDKLLTSGSSCRRATGHGMSHWRFLERSGDLKAPGEFELLLRVMWRYQWVQKPVKLNKALADKFFDITQGNPDLMVKLFEATQRRAINTGVEELTMELFETAYQDEFKAVHGMMNGYRTNSPEILVKYPDIAPIDLRPGPGYTETAMRMKLQNAEKAKGDSANAPPANEAAVSCEPAAQAAAASEPATQGKRRGRPKAEVQPVETPKPRDGVSVQADDLFVAGQGEV